MTLEKFIAKEKNAEPVPLNFNLNKVLKNNKYIAYYDLWYDDLDNPDVLQWVDVEGIGFGWLWIVNPIRKRIRFLQHRAVRKLAVKIYNSVKDSKKFIVDKGNDTKGVIFQFSETEIIQILYSNNKIDWWSN